MTQKNMRVAIITENFLPKLDGVTRTIAMLLEHLQQRGHQAIVFGPEGSVPSYAGAQVIPVTGIPIPFYPELKFLFPQRSMGQSLAHFHPDIIHLADPMLLGMAGLYWARKQSIPVVAAYHTNLADYIAHYGLGWLEQPTWSYRRFLHNQCAATLCPSPSTIAMLRQHGFERLAIWPRGVDSILFAPSKRSVIIRQELGAIDDATTLLLYVGRLSHEKNITILSESYRALAQPGVHLVIVGDGPARAEIEHDLQGYPVTFTGYRSGEALAVIYASCDAFLFPSTTETFGQVVQEAMASGLPVVGANAEGVCDLVIPGKTGILVTPNDVAGFTDAARILIQDVPYRLEMGVNARNWAKQRAWSDVMDALLQLYAAVIAAPPSPPDPDLPETLDDLALVEEEASE